MSIQEGDADREHEAQPRQIRALTSLGPSALQLHLAQPSEESGHSAPHM